MKTPSRLLFLPIPKIDLARQTSTAPDTLAPTMKLTAHAPAPTRGDLDAITRILAHASPPVCVQDILARRPPHRISSWRGVVVWVMNRHHGVPQHWLGSWLGMPAKSAHRLVRGVDRVVVSSAKETESVRNMIRKIIDAEAAR